MILHFHTGKGLILDDVIRSSNYGTRIDYILVTPGLLPWIKDSKTLPQIKGSDHCPVYADFHDSITTQDGQTLRLWEQINPPGRTPEGPTPDPPAFAGRFWPEFAHKLLSSFFGGKASQQQSPSPSSQPTPSASSITSLPTTSSKSLNGQTNRSSSQASSSKHQIEDSDDDIIEVTRSASPPRDKKKGKTTATASQKIPTSQKASTTSRTSGKAKSKSAEPEGQKTLASFFAPPTAKGDSNRKKRKSTEDKDSENTTGRKTKKQSTPTELDEIDVEEQKRLEAAIRDGQAAVVGNSPDTSRAWSKMFQKQPPPVCKGHNEPCKELMTTKPGPNKGRMVSLSFQLTLFYRSLC